MQRNHPLSRPFACLMSSIASLLTPCCQTLAQNLVMPPAAPQVRQPAPTPAQPAASPPASPVVEAQATVPTVPADTGDQLASVSLFQVTAPQPHKYARHDVVEVIVNESSIESFTQTTNLKKDYSLKGELSKFPSFQSLLLDAALREGIGSVHPQIGVTGNKELKGTGKIDRKDQVTAKLSAFVVDVKPNGTLVLEARESRTSGNEVKTMVLSGTCRQEDITKNNTIQSSQLAGLNIRIDHGGDVQETGKKGFVPRVLEAIFNF